LAVHKNNTFIRITVFAECQAQRGAPGLFGIAANTAKSSAKGFRVAAALTVALIT
jgi:hypothetical protein